MRVNKILKARHYTEYRTYKPPSRRLPTLPLSDPLASSTH